MRILITIAAIAIFIVVATIISSETADAFWSGGSYSSWPYRCAFYPSGTPYCIW